MQRAIRQVQMASVIVLALVATACTSRDRAEADSVVERAGETVGSAVDTLAGRIAGREYTNTELLGFIDAYNDAEIEIGKSVQPKLTNPEVKAFAQRIVTEHTALKAEVGKAAQSLNLTPTVPNADEDLREDHQKAMREFGEQARGKDFDEKFLEHEIMMHKKILDEIDDALGRTMNEAIRPVLEKARAGVRAHLTAAEELEKKFGA